MSQKKTERYEDSHLYKIRHSAAHIMAQAVGELFAPGEAKIAIGPPVEDGSEVVTPIRGGAVALSEGSTCPSRRRSASC